jgi:PAS domain S-box/diguanylate cyclase (GGDEF) domain
MDNIKVFLLSNDIRWPQKISALFSLVGRKYELITEDEKSADLIFLTAGGLENIRNLSSFHGLCVMEAESRAAIDDLDLTGVEDVWFANDLAEYLAFRLSRLIAHLETIRESRTNKLYLNTMIDAIPDLVWFKDTAGKHLKVNNAFCKAVEKEKSDIEGRGHYYIWGLSEEEYSRGEFVCMESEEIVMNERQARVFDENVKTMYGMRKFSTNKAPLIDEDGNLMGTVGVAHDVTELLNIGSEIKMLIKSLPDITIVIDANGRINEVNELFFDYFSVSPEEISGLMYSDFRSRLREASEASEEEDRFEIYMKRLGEKVTFKLIDEPIYNVFGEPNGVLCFLRDITEEKKKVETILDVSYTDYLTGLRNRRYMYDNLLERRRDEALSVIFIDIDDFKKFNDTYGHIVGDKVLQNVANAMKTVFEHARNFRVGGDEMLAAFYGDYSLEELAAMAKKLQEVIRNNETDVDITVSIGIANQPVDDVKMLIRNGDDAMYKAKKSGKGKCCIYISEKDEFKLC